MGQGFAGVNLCSSDVLEDYESVAATEICASQPSRYSRAALDTRRPTGATLRGALQIRGSQAVGAKTRLAVAEALAVVARRGQARMTSPKGQCEPGGIHVEVARSPLQPGVPEDTLCFTYAVRLSEGGEETNVRAALEKEAASDGRDRLLPRFLRSLKSHGEECEASQEIWITKWTVESVMAPRVDSDIVALSAKAPVSDPLLFESASSFGPLLASCTATSESNLCTDVMDATPLSAKRLPAMTSADMRSKLVPCCAESELPRVARRPRFAGSIASARISSRPSELVPLIMPDVAVESPDGLVAL